MRASVVVLERLAPPKTPMACWPLIVDPDADRNGPASVRLAGEADPPKGLFTETIERSRPKAVAPAMSVPPAVTVLFVKVTSGLVDVLLTDDRLICRSENSGVM